ncbi:MAG TPA: non-homologous end-joining DNA ligase [Phenylobacterium sp.]
MPVPRQRELPRSQRQYVPPKMPLFAPFQHPKLVTRPPVGSAWLHEVKFDGYRVQVRVAGGQAQLFTRNGHDWTERFPELIAEALELPECILDGELCAVDAEGRPSFSRLRSSIGKGQSAGLVLFAFDMLWREGEDLRPFGVAARKAVLAQVLGEAGLQRVRAVEPFETGGDVLFASACRMGLEGIVSKRRDAPYRGGRSEAWLKTKCKPEQEVVIGGWTQNGARLGSLLAGVYAHGRLEYVGSVKIGVGGDAPEAMRRLKSLRVEKGPFETGGAPRTGREVWARPELVARVTFSEWTSNGKLRQASFAGLRDDKPPEDVVREG